MIDTITSLPIFDDKALVFNTEYSSESD